VYGLVDEWTKAAGIEAGRLFRRVSSAGRAWGEVHRTYEGTAAPVRVSWFSDRIEIPSPGGPYGLVNRNNFGRPGITDYRNPHLAEAMRNLGYVQKFGVGIALARQALLGNANPPLEFRVEDTHVLALIRRRN